jgi:hypothetical protein
MRRLFAAVPVVLAFAFSPNALADGPSYASMQGDPGVDAPSGLARYVAVGDGQSRGTVVQEVRNSDGRFLRWTGLAGSWGIPTVSSVRPGGGLSRDGRVLVLAQYGFGGGALLRKQTSFVLFDTRSFEPTATIHLRGDFSYDALSPSGRMLFLTQRVSSVDASQYVVRAYDLASHRLLARRIADRTQRGWVMAGYPVDRVTSADGRFVYTLFMNPENVPFVHALDTVSATAHCIGLPWPVANDQGVLYNMRLSLRSGGRVLDVHWKSGRRFADFDTRTYRLLPTPPGLRPWAVVLIVVGGLALAASATLVVARRRRVTPLRAAREVSVGLGT